MKQHGQDVIRKVGSWFGRSRVWAFPFSAAWSWLALACLATLLLCSSVFYFSGTKVDESEVVLNALTIATGDWDPVWSPGYGHLAMYLPAFLISFIGFFLYVAGVAGSYQESLYLLFANDAVYRIARFLYALADVGTALVYARVIWIVGKRPVLVAAFLLHFLVSPDTWHYADYVRTDTLVSFFTACAVLIIARPRTRLTPYLLGIALGAAIACKYSAVVYMALIGFLLLPTEKSWKGMRDGLRTAGVAVAATVAATFLFQPLYDYSGLISAIQTHLSGSHFTKEVIPLAGRWIRLQDLVLKLEPFAPWLLAFMLGGLVRPRQAAPLLLAVFVGIAPFALSNFPRDYWLIPFADALRAAGWLGLSCIMLALDRRERLAAFTPWAAAGILAVTLIGCIWRFPDAAGSHEVRPGLSNVEAAKRWLYVNVANRKPLAYIYEKNYHLPRAYSFSDYDRAARLSRVFIFEREGFGSLHELFGRKLYQHEFTDFSSLGKAARLRLSLSAAAQGAAIPELCAGARCIRGEKDDCSGRATASHEDCVAYTWDMERPWLQRDLSELALKLSPSATTFTTCWYDCASPRAEAPIYRRHGGVLPLVDISDRLFVSARLIGISQVSRLPPGNEAVYLVTTPAAYRDWLPTVAPGKKVTGVEFAAAIGAKPVRFFDAGDGSRIEIYEKRVKTAW